MWYRERVSDENKSGDRGNQGDQILRSLIEDGRARLVVTTATQTVREICTRHNIKGIPVVALGRSVLSGLLLATLTKDEEQVTLQVLGNGPLGAVTVDARSSGRVRGFVKHPATMAWDSAKLAPDESSSRITIGEAVGKQGVVSVTRDLGLAQNYGGQIAISSGEIDDEVERYLNTSEQIDSVLRCDTLLDSQGQVTAAAGLLVQTLPQAHGAAVVEFLRDSLRGPAFTEVLDHALSQGRVDPVYLARAALGDCAGSLRVLDERPVHFFCPCSRERAAATLGMLEPEELKEMILETNEAQVSCNFCGSQYRFSEVDLEQIRRKREKNRPKG
jgi:molecular chaperone Hsp33